MIKKPLVSILVHTKNSGRTIEEHLKSIKNQTYRNIEIIVVDNISVDNTLTIAKKFTNKIYTFGPERSAQRNFAAKKANGDYYLVPDSDMVLTVNVVEQCVNVVLTDKMVKAVIIPEKTQGKGFWAKCKAFERDCYLKDDKIEAARFFDKKVYWEMGGYNEKITGPEDWDLSLKIKNKYLLGRINSIIYHDEGDVTLTKLIKKKYYYGKKLSPYLTDHPLNITGSQLIYLLRPAFYKNWKKFLKNPLIGCGTILMLSSEQIAGFLGFLSTKINNKYEK